MFSKGTIYSVKSIFHATNPTFQNDPEKKKPIEENGALGLEK